jgi:hypothetical protein
MGTEKKILSKKVVKKMEQAFYDQIAFFPQGLRFSMKSKRRAVSDGRQNTREDYRNLFFCCSTYL